MISSSWYLGCLLIEKSSWEAEVFEKGWGCEVWNPGGICGSTWRGWSSEWGGKICGSVWGGVVRGSVWGGVVRGSVWGGVVRGSVWGGGGVVRESGRGDVVRGSSRLKCFGSQSGSTSSSRYWLLEVYSVLSLPTLEWTLNKDYNYLYV